MVSKIVMIRFRSLAAVASVALLSSVASAQTPATPAPKPQALYRVAWDDNYLYAAFRVESANVIGSRREPMAMGIEQDDGVGISVKIGDGPVRVMRVSVAGGFTFLENETPKPLFSIKYGVNIDGTLNRSEDKDRSYVVELAIPWSALGATKKDLGPALKLSGSVEVRRRGAATVTVPLPENILAPDARFATLPIIDGVINATEWPGSAKSVELPTEPERAAILTQPLVPLADDTATPPLPTTSSKERRLFARFSLAYQADLGKSALPNHGVFSTAGSFTPVDQPALGFGPWYSADRVGWARTELAQIRRVGIDVALTQVGTLDGGAGMFDAKALFVLVAALREMAQERLDTPQLGLWLDTTTFSGEKPDLATDSGREQLASAVARWFAHVPTDLRASVRVGGVSVCPVFLSDASAFANPTNDAWSLAVRQKLQALGLRVVFVGDGFSGTFSAATVSPGSQTPLVARKGGETYGKSWESPSVVSNPWVVIDSWNDFTRATEIAPSRQYGDFYLEQTRVRALMPDMARAQAVQFAPIDVPRRMKTGSIVTVPLSLTHIGSKIIALDDAGAVLYRWLQNGKVVGESPLKLRLRESLLPGRTTSLPIGVSAIQFSTTGAQSTALPAGDYELQIAFVLPGSEQSITVPVRLEDNPPETVQIASSSLLPLQRTGSTVPTDVRLRWLGKETLPAGEAQLVYQIVTRDGKSIVGSGSVPINQPLPNGSYVTVPASIKFVGEDGLPLEAAFPERRQESIDEKKWGYLLRWGLTRAGATAPIAGSTEEPLALYPGEDDARIIAPSSSQIPATLIADKNLPLKFSVVNRGTTRWEKGKYAVTGRWYQADGFRAPLTQAILNTVIDRPVAPGESVDISLDVKLPEKAGRYILSLLALHLPDQFLAAHPISLTGDSAYIPLDITGGRLTPLDLGTQFNSDAVATEARPSDGAFDGETALPAEWFPSDLFGINRGVSLYPAGYFADVTSEPSRSIVFRYGKSTDGQKNAVTCAGQTLAVPTTRYFALHLAATATGGVERPLALTLKYKDGTTQTVTRTIRDWTKPPAEDDAVAFLVPRWRTPQGDVAGRGTVRHLVIAVGVEKELAAILLPNDPKITVFAVTLEQ